jgi:hypothetical protein
MTKTHNQASKWGGKKVTPTYNSWRSLVQRCLNPNHIHYERYKDFWYPPWKDFTTFYLDMGERPLNSSLDRMDNTKGYSPTNCRWATSKQQSRNKSNNLLSEKEAQQIRDARHCGWPIKALALQFCVSESAIKNILYRGDWQ